MQGRREDRDASSTSLAKRAAGDPSVCTRVTKQETPEDSIFSLCSVDTTSSFSSKVERVLAISSQTESGDSPRARWSSGNCCQRARLVKTWARGPTDSKVLPTLHVRENCQLRTPCRRRHNHGCLKRPGGLHRPTACCSDDWSFEERLEKVPIGETSSSCENRRRKKCSPEPTVHSHWRTCVCY